MNAIALLGRRVIERIRGIGVATLMLLQILNQMLSYKKKLVKLLTTPELKKNPKPISKGFSLQQQQVFNLMDYKAY